MSIVQYDTPLESPADVLSRAASLLSSSAAFDAVLSDTLAACLPALGDFGFLDLMLAGGEVRRTVGAHADPQAEALLRPTRWTPQAAGGLDVCALSTGQPVLHIGIDDDWYRRVARGEGHLALLRQLGFRSMLSVPMHYRGELVGALTLFMARSGRQHDSQHLRTAADVAALAAPVVVNTRLAEQQRAAAAALRDSEERLRLATEAGQLGVWDWDVPAGRVRWSEQVHALHGLVPGGFDGTMASFFRLVHPEDRAGLTLTMRQALRDARSWSEEFRVRWPDGSTRWLSTRAEVLRDEQGQAVRVVGVVLDVTERVELLAAERSARQAAERARTRLERLTAAGARLSRSLDADETMRTIADILVPEIADWCRIDLVDAEGEPVRGLTHHRDPERAKALARAARSLPHGRDTPGSVRWVVTTGRSHWAHYDPARDFVEPLATPHRRFLRDLGLHAYVIVPLVARGRTLGTLAAMQSESRRGFEAGDRAMLHELAHRAALALDNARLFAEAGAARREAENANRAKDEFLAMLGHELRNPLAPIVSALALMQRRGGDVLLRERQIIERQVAHLSRLVDDLLDVSRIARGKVELRDEPVELREVVTRAIELAQPLYERRECPLGLSLPGVPVVVRGDPVRLAQVVANLLTNAAKFTPPERQIALAMRCEDERVHLEVTDEGCGIDADLLPRLFDLFTQGEQTIDRRAGGLGLGLAIVRTLVRLHGGEVRAASDGLGRGSRFTVTLPLAQAAKSFDVPSAPAEAPRGRRTRVLVVDDNRDAAFTIAALLADAGHEVRVAHDAASALAQLERFVPEVALLDIGLPGASGHELGRRLRADPRLASLRMAALTGYGLATDRAAALAHGFDEHLVKPLGAEELLATIARLAGA